MINFDTPIARELEEILYARLVEQGTLSDDEFFDITCILPEYGLRRVSSGALWILVARPDVERLKDENGRFLWEFRIKSDIKE